MVRDGGDVERGLVGGGDLVRGGVGGDVLKELVEGVTTATNDTHNHLLVSCTRYNPWALGVVI